MSLPSSLNKIICYIYYIYMYNGLYLSCIFLFNGLLYYLNPFLHCLCKCNRVCVYVHIYIYIYTHTHTHIHTHTHTHTHTCTHIYEKTKHHSKFLILGMSFSIWIVSVSVGHSKSYLCMWIKNPTDATVCRYLFTAKLLYMFRVSQHPSSGVSKTVPATSGTGRTTCTTTPLLHGLVWSPDQTT